MMEFDNIIKEKKTYKFIFSFYKIYRLIAQNFLSSDL